MSKKRRDPLDHPHRHYRPISRETVLSPAWKQLSMGARILFIALTMRCLKNNGHVYLTVRDAAEELGHCNRNDIANWYRELEHYGFIVKTNPHSLGVDGKGKAPHWRITDLPTRDGNGQLKLATKDFLHWSGTVFEPRIRPSWRWNEAKADALKKQNPGRDVHDRVDVTSMTEVGVTFMTPDGPTVTDVTPICADQPVTDVTPIFKLAIGVSSKGS